MKHGSYKYWDLERYLNESRSPIDKDVVTTFASSSAFAMRSSTK